VTRRKVAKEFPVAGFEITTIFDTDLKALERLTKMVALVNQGIPGTRLGLKARVRRYARKRRLSRRNDVTSESEPLAGPNQS
jgi:hypothetical protein